MTCPISNDHSMGADTHEYRTTRVAVGRSQTRSHGPVLGRRLQDVLGELVQTTAGTWITHPPNRCPADPVDDAFSALPFAGWGRRDRQPAQARVPPNLVPHLPSDRVAGEQPGHADAEPDIFADALQNADIGTLDFEGYRGAAFHKVIRWSFQKQGRSQSPGAASPVTAPGAPPRRARKRSSFRPTIGV